MSRVGKYPVIIPEGVNASINGNVVNVKGKLGELSFAFNDSHVSVEINDGKIVVTPHSQSRTARTLWGTTRAQINSIIKGVSGGYCKSLELIGVGYKARLDGRNLVLSLGFSHDVPFAAPAGITFACESPTVIKISGVDKQLVGQVAAEIRKYRKPEPYKGKGIRVDGEYVRRKEGKKK